LGRIPPASFPYRGPARFEKGPNGGTVFHFDGDFFLPFAGFTFPSPDFVPAHAFVAGDDSELNPVLRFEAIHTASPGASGPGVEVGSRTNVLAGTGERFSYSYSIACNDPGQGGSFEYTNAAEGGTFRMESLASVHCLNSADSVLPPGDFDTITFSGFGTWSEDDELHLATVQILTALGKEYVTIQVDGGFLSNVDTPPVEEPQP
jgi:hypothetical protein